MHSRFARSQAGRNPPKQQARRGSAAVEFAVIAPILAALLLGIFEVTRAVQVKNYLTDAARSSCRIAIQPGNNTHNVTDNISAILAADGINAAYATSTLLVNGQNVDVNTAKKYDQISVKISIPISKVTWVPLFYFTSSQIESETLTMMHY
jgi:hypothetical protein